MDQPHPAWLWPSHWKGIPQPPQSYRSVCFQLVTPCTSSAPTSETRTRVRTCNSVESTVYPMVNSLLLFHWKWIKVPEEPSTPITCCLIDWLSPHQQNNMKWTHYSISYASWHLSNSTNLAVSLIDRLLLTTCCSYSYMIKFCICIIVSIMIVLT